MRIILSGGGTGGHINPALAIAKEVVRREPGSEVLFCGGKGGLEEKLVPREGFRLETFTVHGLSRKLTPKGIAHNVKALAEAADSMNKAKKLIRDFKPDVVVGCGGYASFPIMKAAQSKGVPTAVLEVNAFPGVTTKTLAKGASVLMIAFEDTRRYFADIERTAEHARGPLVVHTGSPVRADILEADRETSRKEMGLDGRPLILSVWGSLGAEMMNRAMADFIALEAESDPHQLVHAIGSHGYAWLPGLIREKGVDLEKHPNIEVRDYVYDMARVLSAADLVLCRGGAATMAELTALGKPAVIVPSPNVAENHQEKNARTLEAGGAAVVIVEKDCDGKVLYDTACELLADPERMAAMQKAMRSFYTPGSMDRIYGCIRNAANG